MIGEPDIHLARAYGFEKEMHGARILVDRIWPRGVEKAALHLDDWIRDVAPKTRLRRWFAHDPAKWREFAKRYAEELDQNPAAVERCAAWVRKGPVTLIYGAKDREHNHAVVLREYLSNKFQGKRTDA